MRKYHHTSKQDDRCSSCNKQYIMYWKDKEEKNGWGETRYGFEGEQVCEDCKTKENDGRPPLSLWDLNEIRKRKISKEQYYKEKGY